MSRWLLHLFTIFSFLFVLASGSTSQDFWPAALPLAVRSPYFSAWQGATAGSSVVSEWPSFWPFNTDGDVSSLRLHS